MPRMTGPSEAGLAAAIWSRFGAAADAAAPRHLRLERAIAAAIEAGALSPQQRLPSERAFADETPLSLGTVQKALKSLTLKGLIDRRQGHGSFVTGRAGLRSAWHFRFLGSDGALVPVHVEATARETGPLPGPARAFLCPDGGRLARIDRRLRLDDHAATRLDSRFFADAGRFPDLIEVSDAVLGDRPIRQWLTARHGIEAGPMEYRLRALPGPPGGLSALILARGRDGRPFYAVDLTIPAGAPELLIEALPPD